MEQGSYLLLQPGMTVLGRDNTQLGTVIEVVADEGADIFRGLVLSLGLRAAHVFVRGEHVTAVVGNTAQTDLSPNELGTMKKVTALQAAPGDPLA